MPREAIVAIFRTSADAAEAAASIRSAGFPTASIRLLDTQHPSWGGQTTSAPGPDSSFWAMLFGGGDAAADQSFEHGGTVLSVVAEPGDAESIAEILNDAGPLEIDRRTEGV